MGKTDKIVEYWAENEENHYWKAKYVIVNDKKTFSWNWKIVTFLADTAFVWYCATRMKACEKMLINYQNYTYKTRNAKYKLIMIIVKRGK